VKFLDFRRQEEARALLSQPTEACEDMGEAKAETPTPRAPLGSKVIPLLMIANTLLVGGVLLFVMMKQNPVAVVGPAAAASGDEERAERGAKQNEKIDIPGPMYKLEQFVIQLKAVDSERYLRVAFDLELRRDPDKELITQRISQIRDSVISYFSDRTLDELRGSDGMNHVKQALRERLDGLVPGRRIKAVYITDFIIQ